MERVGWSMSQHQGRRFGSYSTIAHTSEAILELLRDRIAGRDDVVNVERNEIALVSPADVGNESDIRLGLYLYGIREFRQMSNSKQQVRRNPDPEEDDERPLALSLEYLMTAYPSSGGNDETANSIDQQRVMGLALQVLHQNAIIGKYELPSAMGENYLTINLERQDIDRIEDIYHSLQDATLHPSVTYHVGPVLITGKNEAPSYPSGDRTKGWEMGFGQAGDE